MRGRARSTAKQAGEVRFEGFGLLSGQNGPPEGEQGAQPSRRSWRGPFWRIWAAQRTKRSTRERKGQRPMRLEEQGTSVLKDLGCSPAKTDHQRESKEHSPANQAGEVCFGGFGQGGSWGGPSALEDLRCSADKTEYQREKGAQKHSHRRQEDT